MSETADDTEQVNILLVDDRPGNLLSLKGVLERPDYNLIMAKSGQEALSLVLRHEFAVILMDVAMPEMDGFEVASTIKQRERYKTIPIIFVTASVQQIEWIYRAYSVGAVDFLNKPFDPHAVRSKVAVFVELFRQKQQLKRQAAQLRENERREREFEVTRLKLENERRYRNLAEAIPHIVWTAGPAGDIEYFNRRWFDATGLCESDSLGTGWHAALHEDDAPQVNERWTTALESGTSFAVECRLRQADGSYRWYLCRALPEQEGTGLVTRWLGTFTDVDEQKRAHEESRAALRIRDEFLSVASHELRTPLTALNLQLQSLRQLIQRSHGDRLNAPMAKKLTTALRQTSRLAALVDSLLDVSRIATGRLELRLEELDLVEVAQEVIDRFREEAERAGCELRLQVNGEAIGRWDRIRIEQVLTNLLSNALKYAPGKPIDVAVGADGQAAVLSVRDRGIGIAPEHLPRIFGRFERAVPSRNYGGLGLGLYIAGQIVEAHGGKIDVSSQPGEGSVFTLCLPLTAEVEKTPAREKEAQENEHVEEPAPQA